MLHPQIKADDVFASGVFMLSKFQENPQNLPSTKNSWKLRVDTLIATLCCRVFKS